MILYETLQTQLDTTNKVVRTNVKCKAYLSTAQNNLTDTQFIKVLLDGESYDIGNNYDTTNKRFVAPVTGYYQVNAAVMFQNTIASKYYEAHIYVNGSSYAQAIAANGIDPYALQSVTLNTLAAVTAGQYIELYCRVICGASTVDLNNSANTTYMAIHLLSTD